MIRKLMVCALLLCAGPVHADQWVSGRVTDILTGVGDTYVLYIKLDPNPPASTCGSGNWLMPDPSWSEKLHDRYYAMAMLAYSTGREVDLWRTDSCQDGYHVISRFRLK